MKRSLNKVFNALQVTQMIVPEVDLNVQQLDNELRVGVVPLHHWHFYLDAIENASDLLLEEVSDLPDVKPVEDLQTIIEDMKCLIVSLNVFYFFMMEDIGRVEREVEKNFNRFTRYQNKPEGSPEDES